jgi:transposase
MVDLDQLVSADHPVRLVVSFVAIDPALLMGLWLFATVEGVGSARELARLCTQDLPYRWLCGGVGVNHAVRWRGSEPPRFE